MQDFNVDCKLLLRQVYYISTNVLQEIFSFMACVFTGILLTVQCVRLDYSEISVH
jgi:hypothetical protein